MPFSRPTLANLVDLTAADFSARLPGADAQTRRSNIAVLARVLAGGEHGLYGYIDWASRQFLPDTADDENLDRHGGLWGITRKAATYAAGTVTFTGTVAAAIPVGTSLRRSDGIDLSTTSFAVIGPGGTANVAVAAVTAADDGNTGDSTPLSLISPVLGINSTAIVTTALAGGTNRETDTDYRDRILERLRQPPHGGNQADYIAWAKQVPGVTRAWASGIENGAGTVTVRFMMDDIRQPNGIPLSEDVTIVANYIEELRPVTALLFVAAPTPVPLDILITSLDPNISLVQEAIRAEVADFIRRESSPGGTLWISRLRETISAAAGEFDHTMTTPDANISVSSSQISVPGTVTFSS